MKKILLITSLFMTQICFAQNFLVCKSASIAFFSKTPMKDIDAKNTKAQSAIDINKNTLIFKVKITDFIFKDKLMQEHFNENYMDSEQYPTAEFNGTIQNKIDLHKDGIYQSPIVGKLTIHGVTKDYTTNGNFAVKDGKVVANSIFKIALRDHNIKIPKLVAKEIAEEVEVTVNAGYDKK